jgi:HPt (histidine-containing phosphotransfer) domain-containing protein
VLQKPITTVELLVAVRRYSNATGPTARSMPAIWDESRALSAVGGKAESARALRNLFLEELPGQVASVRAAFAASDHATIRHHLHRLKASCGFVGADRLLLAVNKLSADMDVAIT